jgi:pyrroline-5-carboxylate reductase
MKDTGGKVMTRRLGFIGTGTIAAAMVRGLKGSSLQDWPILLSPRSPDVARSLAREFSGVEVAADNQAVIDGVDMVILAVRPQVAESVLQGLQFREEQDVVSLIAATPASRITDWTGATRVCRAIPLPFVEDRRDVTPIFPPHPAAMQLFDVLGRALPVRDQADFDIYAALSALMETYFAVVGTAAGWASGQGLPERDARLYLSGLFQNLGIILNNSQRTLPELRADHSTPGGLNEQVASDFKTHGGTAALAQALSDVLLRVREG